MERERQRDLALLALGFDGSIEIAEQAHPALIAETEAVPDGELLCGSHQRLPARAVEPPDQRRLDLRLGGAADPPSGQLRGNDLGVVDDELVTWFEPIRQVRNDAIVQSAALHHQHFRGIARVRRAQRDACRGQLEIEEIGTHREASKP